VHGKKTWKLKPASPLTLKLAGEAGLSPLQAQLLINRGVSETDAALTFMQPRLNNLADPEGFQDMDAALTLILDAIEKRENITIYGDYDADGITATALLLHFFCSLNIPVGTYIPDRFREGYGINAGAVRKIAARGPGVIISVDCGTSNTAEITLAQSLGLRVVVTDHHQVPADRLPPCPVINPHRPENTFPFSELAGVGVAFFLTAALRRAARRRGWFAGTLKEPDLRRYLDLVAVGTVADRVSLLGQNRVLVHHGLHALKESEWPGLEALKAAAQINAAIGAEDVAFRLAPRLNAPGRMGRSEMGLRVLTTGDPSAAAELAVQVSRENQRRQDIEKKLLEHIEEKIRVSAGFADCRTLFVAGADWHEGILGLVASRLVDRYHRPAFVLSVRDGVARGSARSISGFNLYRALGDFGHLFERFGGHAQAAGFALEAAQVESMRAGMEKLAGRLLSEEDLTPSLEVDAELDPAEVSAELLERLKFLAPYGEGNPEPRFLGRSVEVLNSRVVGEKHLKLHLRQAGKTLEAIGFWLGAHHPLEGKRLDLVFTPEVNHWQGYERLQLRILDLAPAGVQLAVSP
jgi:single-stranded-DNA-specific exonuclease